MLSEKFLKDVSKMGKYSFYFAVVSICQKYRVSRKLLIRRIKEMKSEFKYTEAYDYELDMPDYDIKVYLKYSPHVPLSIYSIRGLSGDIDLDFVKDELIRRDKIKDKEIK